MRYSLLLHYPEPTEGQIDPEMIAQAQRAFQAYAAALDAAGVLIAAEVLQPSAATTTVTRRTGDLSVQDGPFAATVEALAGVFVLDGAPPRRCHRVGREVPRRPVGRHRGPAARHVLCRRRLDPLGAMR